MPGDAAAPPPPSVRTASRLRISPACRGLPVSNPADIFRLTALCERSYAGDREASFTLGTIYATGRGVPQDRAMALSFLRLSAEQGHPDSRARIAALEGGTDRLPVVKASGSPPAPAASPAPPDPAPTVTRAAGSKPLTLAECRRRPVYYPAFYPQLSDLCDRALRGDAAAYYDLGALFDGGRQVPRNEALAVRLYRLSAQLGNREARLRLAAMGYPDPV